MKYCWILICDIARLAIVAKKHKLFSTPDFILWFTIVAKKWLTMFFFSKKMCVCVKKKTRSSSILFWRLSCSFPFPKRSVNLLSNPYERTIFPQMSKTLDHERLQFTWVGLLPRFGITAFFPKVILEPREERKTFYKSSLLFLFLFLSSCSYASFSLSLSLFLFLSFYFSFSISFSSYFSFCISFSSYFSFSISSYVSFSSSFSFPCYTVHKKQKNLRCKR